MSARYHKLVAHMKILQQSATAVPAPVDAASEVRGLLKEDGRGGLGALRRERQDVDGNFLLSAVVRFE